MASMKTFAAIAVFLFLLVGQAHAQFSLISGYPQGGTITFGYGGFSTSGSTRSSSCGGVPSGCDGPINYSWIWNYNNPNMPQYVILTVTSSASWSGNGGTANDGQSDQEHDGGPPPPAPPTVGSASGTHYYLKPVPLNGVVDYTINPSAFCGSGGCGVSVTASITPLVINLGGITNFSNAQNILVGQTCSGSVSGIPSSATTSGWSWGVPGNYFKSWSGSLTASTLNTTVPLNIQYPSWTWKSCGGVDDGPHAATVTVSFSISIAGQSLGSASLFTNLNVWRPYQSIAGHFTGPSGYGAYPYEVHGTALITGTLGTPGPFVNGSGSGLGAFCQLVKLDNSLADHGYTFWHDTTNGYVLDIRDTDISWPYSTPWSTPIDINGHGASGVLSDEPGLDSFSISPFDATYYSLNYQFHSYLMYQPPSGQWVPSAIDNWKFVSSKSSPFTGTPPGTCVETSSYLTDTFPSWTGNHVSSN